MSDSNDDIRQAKVRAAERVIYERLRRHGLTSDQAKEMAVNGAPELAQKESTMTTTTNQTGKLSTRCWAGNHHGCGLDSAFCDCDCHQPAPTQPAPDAGGEWQVEREPIHGFRVMEAGRKVVGNIYFEEDAAQIVADHNVVPKLVDALVKARNDAQVFTGAQYLDTAIQGLQEIVRGLDAVLATTTPRDRGGE